MPRERYKTEVVEWEETIVSKFTCKNFAIIDEIDVDFSSGLNILTGETGAGKSILIGSIGIALGARVSQEIIGKHGDSAMVEIVSRLKMKKQREIIRIRCRPGRRTDCHFTPYYGKPECKPN